MREVIAAIAFMLVLSLWPAFANEAVGRLLHEARRAPEEQDFGRAALLAAQAVRAEVDVDQRLGELDGLARGLRRELGRLSDPRERLASMATYLFRTQGFADSESVSPTVYVGFDEVLDKRQWNCVAMSALYVALGERIGMPLRLVSGPGHVLVMHAGDAELYVETTQRGRIHPSKAYLREYLPFPNTDPDDYAALETPGAIAVVVTQAALAQQESGRMALARTLFEAALTFDPGHAEAAAGIAFQDLAAGRLEAAERGFRRAIHANPRLREAYGGLGNTLQMSGRLSEALEVYRAMTARWPDEPNAAFNYGQLLYEAGDLDGAIRQFRRYTELAPTDPTGFARLAFPLEDKGDVEGALAAYQAAVRLDPGHRDALANMGLLYERAGRLDDAYKTYAAASRRGYAFGFGGLGRVSAERGDLRTAVTCLQRATEMDDADPAIWMDYAGVLRRAGRSDEAVRAYRRALVLAPGAGDAYRGLYGALRSLNRSSEAEQVAREARAAGVTLSGETAWNRR